MTSTVRGMANGFVDKKNLAEIAREIGREATERFGHAADAVARQQNFPHVYEYVSEADNSVDTSPSGRLWELYGVPNEGGIAFRMRFKQSSQPGGPHPDLLRRFPNMASHLFPDKAQHLETTQQLTARAGVQQYTTRYARSPGQPTMLIFLRPGGTVGMQRSRSWSNEFYGSFGRFFERYWEQQFRTLSKASERHAAQQVKGFAEAHIHREAASARAMSRNPMPTRPGVTIFDKGRPATGIRADGGRITRSVNSMKKFLKREVVRAWRR